MRKYWEQFRKMKGSFLIVILALYFLVSRVLTALRLHIGTDEQWVKFFTFVFFPLAVVILVMNLVDDVKQTHRKPVVIVLDVFCLILLLLMWGIILYFGFRFGFDQ